jgi:serine/threonine protein kinase
MWVSENLVGRGGYAEVYRGTLRDGEEIAVKRLTNASNDERKEKEFLIEIGTIGHVCHPNVLSLLGCCIENGLYLIFHFSSKGSVSSILHGISTKTYKL